MVTIDDIPLDKFHAAVLVLAGENSLRLYTKNLYFLYSYLLTILVLIR